jgi:RHS repeat-associated protein
VADFYCVCLNNLLRKNNWGGSLLAFEKWPSTPVVFVLRLIDLELYSSARRWPPPTYDNNGSLTDDGTSGCGGGPSDCYTYKYDANNYAVSVTTSSGTTNVIRDAFGRTVEIAGTPTTEILYSPAGKTAIMSGANVQAVFAQLPGGSEMEWHGGSYLFHHKDWLDSSRFISIRGSRSMYFDTAYAPFGENYVPSGTTDLDFTDKRQDVVTGIYDFQYREYNPNQGRWLSPDPAGNGAVDPSDPQSWNRYSYVQNSALSKTDPLGLMAAASGDGEFRIEGVDIPSYIFAELAGGVAGALINCYGWCDQINKTVPAPTNTNNNGATYTLVVGAAGPVWMNNVSGEEMTSIDDGELGLPDYGSGGQSGPPAPPNKACGVQPATGFMQVHKADAATLANELHVPTNYVLAVAGNESAYGTSNIAVGANNYFGLHAGAPGSIGPWSGNPIVAAFAPNGGFMASARASSRLLRRFLVVSAAQ